jgi:hypothetical protein
MPGVRYFEMNIGFGAPAPNAVVGGSFTVSGGGSCDLMENQPGEPGIFIRHANDAITNVTVALGSAAAVNATPTGPAGTPWTSWTFPVSGRPNGPLTITATMFASGSGASGNENTSRSVTVDVTPPTFTINRLPMWCGHRLRITRPSPAPRLTTRRAWPQSSGGLAVARGPLPLERRTGQPRCPCLGSACTP